MDPSYESCTGFLFHCLRCVVYVEQTPLGGIHLYETRRNFIDGCLHPANVLMCPHTCVSNLPKPRELHPGHYHLARFLRVFCFSVTGILFKEPVYYYTSNVCVI